MYTNRSKVFGTIQIQDMTSMTPLPFLRALPLPLPSTVKHGPSLFRKSFLSCRSRHGTDAFCEPFDENWADINPVHNSSATQRDSVASPVPAPPAPTNTHQDIPPLSYHVYRTPSQELPVYHLTKRGGNLLQTQLRKIEGDRQSLCEELRKALDLRPRDITINQVTGHIIIKVSILTLQYP